MSRNPLLVDAGIAVVAAVIVLILAPGLAVVGIIALLTLAVCGLTLILHRRANRRRGNTRVVNRRAGR